MTPFQDLCFPHLRSANLLTHPLQLCSVCQWGMLLDRCSRDAFSLLLGTDLLLHCWRVFGKTVLSSQKGTLVGNHWGSICLTLHCANATHSSLLSLMSMGSNFWLATHISSRLGVNCSTSRRLRSAWHFCDFLLEGTLLCSSRVSTIKGGFPSTSLRCGLVDVQASANTSLNQLEEQGFNFKIHNKSSAFFVSGNCPRHPPPPS